jgi:hypothetical protein
VEGARSCSSDKAIRSNLTLHTVCACSETPCYPFADSSTASSYHNGRHKPLPERTRRPPHPHPTCQASLQSCCPRSRRIYVVLRMFLAREELPIEHGSLTRDTAYVQSLSRRPGTHWPEAPLGPLNASTLKRRMENGRLLRQSEKPCIYTAAETRRWA